MTLLGKIFTVLIFVMSLVFMSFTVMTFATHKNWKEAVTAEGGLKDQISDLQLVNQDLEQQTRVKKEKIAEERAARQRALAGLHSKYVNIQTLLDSERVKTGQLEASLTELAQNLTEAETRAKTLLAEVQQLQDEIKTARETREEHRQQAVALSDQHARLESKYREVEERRNQLAQQVVAREKVMKEYGLTVHSLTERTPPVLYGQVTQISSQNNKILEISLGSDDGLRVDHQVDVYRERSYLGRATIRKVTHNKAVAEVVFLKSPIRRGDSVTTKLTNGSI